MSTALLVADSGVSLPRYQVTGTELGAPRPFVTVNGAAAAGSKSLLGSADALVEQTIITFDADDDVRTVVLIPEIGQGSHGFTPWATYGFLDQTEAAARLNVGYPDVQKQPSGVLVLSSDVAFTTIAVIAAPVVGATAASVTGRIYVEGLRHAQ